MHGFDVKRALVRGAVVATASAILVPLGAFVFLREPELVGRLGSFAVFEITLPRAALFGAFTGLAATPVALVELRRARRPRSFPGDFGAALLVGVLAALLVALAMLQGVYTSRLIERQSWIGGLDAVFQQLHDDDDTIGYAILCAAGAAPVFATSFARIAGAALWLQVLAASIFTGIVAVPVVIGLSDASDGTIPAEPIVAWIVGTALLLGPLASLADAISLRLFAHDEDPSMAKNDL